MMIVSMLPRDYMRSHFFRIRSASSPALAWLVLLVSVVSCGSDRDGPSGSYAPSDPPDAHDSLPAPDSLPVGDSLPPADSLPPTDTLPPVDSVPPPEPPGDSVPRDTVVVPDSTPTRPPTHSGIPFGPFRLWRDSAELAWGPEPFTLSFNSIEPSHVVARVNVARQKNHRLVIALSTGHSRYMTGGRFDLAKWKDRINSFNQPDIKAAIAAGVADGTIIGNSVLDEPNTGRWGGNIDKAMLDGMCTYVKSIFPTLPNGISVVHWWRADERYKECDFIIDQWSWWYGPHGPGPGSYTGNISAWRDEALRQVKKDGVAIVFSMNLLDGGIQSWATRTCPSGTTGGKGTVGIACRMTPSQVREWGLMLGPLGCAMLMWRHDAAFVAKEANLEAFRDIAARLGSGPVSNCRRPG